MMMVLLIGVSVGTKLTHKLQNHNRNKTTTNVIPVCLPKYLCRQGCCPIKKAIYTIKVVRSVACYRLIIMMKERQICKGKTTPASIKNIENWKLSRRKFVGSIFMAGAMASLPMTHVIGRSVSDTSVLTQNQFSIVKSVQKILYPSDGNGPGAYDVLADSYLLWVLSDERMDPEEIDYIINGIGWVDETAEENFSKGYLQLNPSEKETLIADISKETWGTSWLGVILTFIFEALLSDPQYGGNIDEIGWDWVQHNPGNPRPTEALLYPEIFETVE